MNNDLQDGLDEKADSNRYVFSKGDVVQFRSGGPDMTIAGSPGEKNPDQFGEFLDRYICYFYSNDTLEKCHASEDDLVIKNIFSNGDAVQLKSGGPQMTVIASPGEVQDSGREVLEWYDCKWAVGDVSYVSQFDECVLRRCDHSDL